MNRNEILDTADYDFQIVDTPGELHEWVRQRNREKNKARMVAGYCWEWVSKKQPQLKDIEIRRLIAKSSELFSCFSADIAHRPTVNDGAL